jgi:SPOR domain
MGESANQLRTEIDVAEFERRLRGATSLPVTYEDPLAELARLVDGKNLSKESDPFRELFAAPRRSPEHRPAPAAPSLGREHAFFADLRGSFDGQHAAELPPDVVPSHAPPVAAPEAQGEGEYADPATAWAEHEAAPADAEPAARRSRKPLYAMGAIICAGLVGIGASFAMRTKAPGSQELALVKAPAGPVKVQPQNPGGVDVPNQSASILDRSAGAPQVTKVVTREEQPVDLDQQVKQMRVITIGGAKDGSVSSVSGQGAASVPVPPPPATTASTSNNGFPEPKRVKTVSVRPEGSVITADASPAPANDPIAALAAGRPAPSAAAESALPKSATPKSTARVATTPKVEAPAAAPSAAAQAPAVPAKPRIAAAPKPAPVKVASAEADGDTAPATTASTGGGFAVQLAAPATEQEARSASVKLGAKFADALGGRRPAVVKAEVGDKSIYRVRVSSLSREEAVSLCEKVKAKGGACFVAKN